MTRPVNSPAPPPSFCALGTDSTVPGGDERPDRATIAARIMAARSAFKPIEAIGLSHIDNAGQITVDEARADQIVARIVDEISPLTTDGTLQ